MRLAQEIAATDSLRTDGSCSWFEQDSRLVGSHSYPVRTRSFSMPCRERGWTDRAGPILPAPANRCTRSQTVDIYPAFRDTSLSQSDTARGEALLSNSLDRLSELVRTSQCVASCVNLGNAIGEFVLTPGRLALI
jgi:hypothetical protein